MGKKASLSLKPSWIHNYNCYYRYYSKHLAVVISLCASRIFIFGAIVLCYVIIAEEMPARLRARGLAFELSVGGFGSLLGAQILPFCLSQTWIGKDEGWRIMYLLSLMTLAVVPLFIFLMKETGRFQQVKARGRDRNYKISSKKKSSSTYRMLFGKGYRKFLIVLTLAWLGFQVPFGVSNLLHVFTVRERNWTADMISYYGMTIAILGIIATNFKGLIMDKIGRRWSAVLMFGSTGVMSTLFYLVPGYQQMFAMGVLQTIFGGEAVLLNVINTEFFSTEVRATGASWAAGMAKLGLIASPVLFGYLVSTGFTLSQGLITMQLPWSMLGLMILFLYLPETKNRSLEEIVEKEVESKK